MATFSLLEVEDRIADLEQYLDLLAHELETARFYGDRQQCDFIRARMSNVSKNLNYYYALHMKAFGPLPSTASSSSSSPAAVKPTNRSNSNNNVGLSVMSQYHEANETAAKNREEEHQQQQQQQQNECHFRKLKQVYDFVKRLKGNNNNNNPSNTDLRGGNNNNNNISKDMFDHHHQQAQQQYPYHHHHQQLQQQQQEEEDSEEDRQAAALIETIKQQQQQQQQQQQRQDEPESETLDPQQQQQQQQQQHYYYQDVVEENESESDAETESDSNDDDDDNDNNNNNSGDDSAMLDEETREQIKAVNELLGRDLYTADMEVDEEEVKDLMKQPTTKPTQPQQQPQQFCPATYPHGPNNNNNNNDNNNNNSTSPKRDHSNRPSNPTIETLGNNNVATNSSTPLTGLYGTNNNITTTTTTNSNSSIAIVGPYRSENISYPTISMDEVAGLYDLGGGKNTTTTTTTTTIPTTTTTCTTTTTTMATTIPTTATPSSINYPSHDHIIFGPGYSLLASVVPPAEATTATSTRSVLSAKQPQQQQQQQKQRQQLMTPEQEELLLKVPSPPSYMTRSNEIKDKIRMLLTYKHLVAQERNALLNNYNGNHNNNNNNSSSSNNNNNANGTATTVSSLTVELEQINKDIHELMEALRSEMQKEDQEMAAKLEELEREGLDTDDVRSVSTSAEEELAELEEQIASSSGNSDSEIFDVSNVPPPFFMETSFKDDFDDLRMRIMEHRHEMRSAKELEHQMRRQNMRASLRLLFTNQPNQQQLPLRDTTNFNKLMKRHKGNIVAETKTKDGKRILQYDTGLRELHTASSIKEIYPDGHLVYRYNNGDVKKIFPRDRIEFFNHRANVRHITFASDTSSSSRGSEEGHGHGHGSVQIFHYLASNRIEKRYPDGTTLTLFPDGFKQLYHAPTQRKEIAFPNGLKQILYADGRRQIVRKDGSAYFREEPNGAKRGAQQQENEEGAYRGEGQRYTNR